MRAFLTCVARFAGYGGALFLAVMMLVTVADVLLRALFNVPITGAYDLVQLFLVGTVFLSIPDVFLRDENIVIDFVDHFFARIAVALLKVAANVAGLVFLVVLSWRMITPALESMQFNEVSPDLSVPMIVHWTLMVAGIVLAIPTAVLMLAGSVHELAAPRAVP